MEFKDLVAVSGQGGLHKIIGRNKNGLILETIGTAKRFATSTNDKVSVLEEVSMFTTADDMRLSDVLFKLNEKGNVPSSKDDAKIQRDFLIDLIQLDSERVYDSDIKKLLTWYDILKDKLDFAKLIEVSEVAGEEANEESKAKIAVSNLPKNMAPKNIAAKSSNKGGAKMTYRPKSGT